MIINDGEVKKADIAKIHSEINQILNQRYNFIAIAITIFGFFIASFNFKEKLHISIPYLDNGCIITIVFLFILSTINYFISILTRQFYILRNYLIVNNFSFWERDYSKFIEKHLSVSYTKSLRILLLLLGILMLFISFCDADVSRPSTL